MYILSINAGSSSMKFQLFTEKDFFLVAKGVFEEIGMPNSKLTINSKKKLIFNIKCANQHLALQLIFKKLLQLKIITSPKEIHAVGHRFVHGGMDFYKPTIINHHNLEKLKKLLDLAPLHNPSNYLGIVSCLKLMPKTKQVVVFDTAFHHDIPPKSYTYALPEKIQKKFNFRRFGFHGINHHYISLQAISILKKEKKKYQKIVTCHLGNGISLTAIKNGKSIDTSMGYTPLEGPLMGTRSGTIDPALPLILCQKLKKTPEEILMLLNKKSGLFAISRISSDFRLIRRAADKGNKQAQLTIKILAYQLAKNIGAYTAALNGLDAIVFSGGIGEHAHSLRHEICSYLTYLGIKLNKSANLKHHQMISSKDSAIAILIIPANEEKYIAKQTLALL